MIQLKGSQSSFLTLLERMREHVFGIKAEMVMNIRKTALTEPMLSAIASPILNAICMGICAIHCICLCVCVCVCVCVCEYVCVSESE